MIKGTLYEQYIRERDGLEITETEDAFIIFKINGQECFIQDCKSIKAGAFRKVFEDLIYIAKVHKCEFISGIIRMFDKRHDETLAIALHMGFKTVDVIKSGNPKEDGIVIVYSLGDK